MDKTYLEYRFGFMAVKKGFATPEQVSNALEVQFEENILLEKHRLIGEIMIDRGVMNASQVDEVLAQMSPGPPKK
jgi:hypothetical protein